MRIVSQIPHPECKITFYSWNNRYLIKVEQGYLEQTFKIDQFDISDEQELIKLMDAEFLQQTLKRFQEMSASLREAIIRVTP